MPDLGNRKAFTFPSNIDFFPLNIIITNTRGITPLQKVVGLLARQPEREIPLVSSLAAGEIVDEGYGPREVGHGRGSRAWGRVAPVEKKAGQWEKRRLEEG